MLTGLLAGAAFLGFAALTVRTLMQHSYTEFFEGLRARVGARAAR